MGGEQDPAPFDPGFAPKTQTMEPGTTGPTLARGCGATAYLQTGYLGGLTMRAGPPGLSTRFPGNPYPAPPQPYPKGVRLLDRGTRCSEVRP